MDYEFARINLACTNYQPTVTWQYIQCNHQVIAELNQIYQTYCRYKKFKSVMPIFDSEYTDANNDIIGYYDQGQLVAFSLLHRFDSENVESVQFAWTYTNPGLRLGIESLKTECALYRDRGFRYLYLDYAHKYKQSIQGFETLGPAE